MSKVLFWSPYHGLGQTANIHATSLIISLLLKKSVLLMQTHFKNNNLESPLVGYNVDKGNVNNDLFQGIGLDMAVTYSNMNNLNLKTLESCCLTFPSTSILLLPGTETTNKETYDRDIGRSVGRLLMDAESLVDFVLIDANSGSDELSNKLMDIADLIVINLTQRRYVLDKFFRDYGDKFIDKKNVFYLFGDYDDNSSYNINNFRNKYSKYISRDNSGVIPYCTKYLDALNESNVIKFMTQGLRQKRLKGIQRVLNMAGNLFSKKYNQEETEYFFHRSRLSVEKMFALLNISIRKELREE